MPSQKALLISLVTCVLLQMSLEARQTVGATMGAITGTVSDTSGAVLPGVTVSISSDELMGSDGTRTTVTNEEGVYRFSALSPGDYTIVFALEGFTTLCRQDVHVGVGFTATVNVALDIAAAA